MAPILSFTAEEAWKVVHPLDPTIFVHVWDRSLPDVPDAAPLFTKWERIVAVRALVQKELEELRQGGGIGSPLQAEVEIVAPPVDCEALASLGDDLRFVLITSAAKVRPGASLEISVKPSTNPKCERCWHWRADVGADPRHPTLCGRCVANLFGDGEPRTFA
jgi:isoleucyl-tRNA synthetase